MRSRISVTFGICLLALASVEIVSAMCIRPIPFCVELKISRKLDHSTQGTIVDADILRNWKARVNVDKKIPELKSGDLEKHIVLILDGDKEIHEERVRGLLIPTDKNECEWGPWDKFVNGLWRPSPDYKLALETADQIYRNVNSDSPAGLYEGVTFDCTQDANGTGKRELKK